MTEKSRRARVSHSGKSGKGRTVGAAAKEAESKLAREARRAGATGRQDRSGPGAAARLVARDKAILAGHHAGRSSAELASQYKVTKRTVDRVLKAARERRSALTVPSMDLVQRALGEYESQMELFTSLGVAAVEAYAWAPAVGAFKAAAEAHERWMLTLSELGILPEELRIFRSEAELARLGQLVLDTMGEVEAGRMEISAGRDRVLELVGRRELPTLEGSLAAG